MDEFGMALSHDQAMKVFASLFAYSLFHSVGKFTVEAGSDGYVVIDADFAHIAQWRNVFDLSGVPLA